MKVDIHGSFAHKRRGKPPARPDHQETQYPTKNRGLRVRCDRRIWIHDHDNSNAMRYNKLLEQLRVVTRIAGGCDNVVFLCS
jgi:hypothetical protein